MSPIETTLISTHIMNIYIINSHRDEIFLNLESRIRHSSFDEGVSFAL